MCLVVWGKRYDGQMVWLSASIDYKVLAKVLEALLRI